jgi:uncharacterized metal-binding protein YceD (DUF177 family)
VPVAVDDIPETGLHLAIEAPVAARAELAEFAGVRDLPQLSAMFDLTRKGAGVHVSGHVRARVGQTCVVTLEPIENAVDEVVDLDFAPSSEPAAKAKGTRKRGHSNDDMPEPLVGGMLDLGALAVEFLILGIDPYPRKADAKFALPKDEDTGEHPFAALESLKKTLGGGQT